MIQQSARSSFFAFGGTAHALMIYGLGVGLLWLFLSGQPKKGGGRK